MFYFLNRSNKLYKRIDQIGDLEFYFVHSKFISELLYFGNTFFVDIFKRNLSKKAKNINFTDIQKHQENYFQLEIITKNYTIYKNKLK